MAVRANRGEPWPYDDGELVARLVETNFDGEPWRTAAGLLARYAVGTIQRMFADGSIGAHMHRVGASYELNDASRKLLDHNPELWRRLACEAVERGLRLLKWSIMNDRWDPNGTATLRTWHVNGSLRTMRDVLRTWERDRRLGRTEPDRESTLAHGTEPTPARDHADDIIDAFANRHEVAQILESTTGTLRAAFELKFLHPDETWQQIADRLDVSLRSLEGLRYRWRRTYRPRRDDDGTRPTGGDHR